MHARLRTRTPVAAGALGIAVLMLSVGADLAVPTGTTAEAADCTEHTLFVAGASPAPTGDRSFQSAIEDRNPGLSCLVTIDDDVVTVADAEAVDVVVISSSVKPSTLGDRLRDAAVPILVAEPFLFDDMSMAPSRGGGELAGRTSINIVDSDNPLAGGLSGRVRVFDTASEVSYGTLDSGSLLEHQVANTGSTSRRSTIFAYETGDQLVDTGDVARAGRVGFFPSFGAELTDDARTLTSASIDWLVDQGPCQGVDCTSETSPRVLLVAGSTDPPSADRPIVSVIEAAGVLVDIADDDANLTAIDLSAYQAVFVSATVVPNKVGDTFRDTPIPVMVWEGALFDEMALSNLGRSTTPRTNLVIADPTHGLAADLGAGGHRVYANPHPLSFGRPSADAEVVAHEQGNRNRAVIFAYDAGDLRIDGTPSPALRVGLFPSADGGADLSLGGEQLVAAAVDWVLAGGPPPNDDFADRFPAVVGSMTGDNVGATIEPNERTFFVDLFVETSGSVWWEWTAPFTGGVQIDTAGSTFATHLAVWQGDGVDPGSLTVLARNSDWFSPGSLVGLQVTAGETYQISVSSLAEIDTGAGVRGDIVLNIAEAPVVPNDHFADAMDFVGPSMTGSNINATLESGEVVPGVIDAEDHGTSVWWTWVADRDGTVYFNTSGSSFDTVLAVWTGDRVDALVEVASGDDTYDATSDVSFDATTGTTYHIAVSGWRGDSGAVVLNGPS